MALRYMHTGLGVLLLTLKADFRINVEDNQVGYRIFSSILPSPKVSNFSTVSWWFQTEGWPNSPPLCDSNDPQSLAQTYLEEAAEPVKIISFPDWLLTHVDFVNLSSSMLTLRISRSGVLI